MGEGANIVRPVKHTILLSHYYTSNTNTNTATNTNRVVVIGGAESKHGQSSHTYNAYYFVSYCYRKQKISKVCQLAVIDYRL